MKAKTWIAASLIGILSAGCGSSDTDPSGSEKNQQQKEETQITNWDSYQYEIPVIFHVLYVDKNQTTQYVSHTRLKAILEEVNKFYAGTKQGTNINVTFTLPQADPNGKAMATQGVEYIKWTGDYPITPSEFMGNNDNIYTKYLWDPNQYINVMMYNFYAENENYTTLGISHMPYTSTGNHPLEGLQEIKETSLKKGNLRYPYSVSINSLYINENSDDTYYNPKDITVTLAHELGHYLGLHHVFSEDENGEVADNCKDTDYCKDTPSYNKKEYDEYCEWAMAGNVESSKLFSTLVKRTNCSNQTFESTNLMDYEISHSNQFTSNQRDRIRHVLMYSPLIPGPKRSSRSSETAPEGPMNLPIRIVK